jgi:hypothetical protein
MELEGLGEPEGAEYAGGADMTASSLRFSRQRKIIQPKGTRNINSQLKLRPFLFRTQAPTPNTEAICSTKAIIWITETEANRDSSEGRVGLLTKRLVTKTVIRKKVITPTAIWASTQVQFRWRWNQFSPFDWLLNTFCTASLASWLGSSVGANPYGADGSLANDPKGFSHSPQYRASSLFSYPQDGHFIPSSPTGNHAIKRLPPVNNNASLRANQPSRTILPLISTSIVNQ